MMTKTRPAAVQHALARSSKIGWRVDCLGKCRCGPTLRAPVVTYKLYNTGARRYVWDDTSSLDLQTLLPTGDRPVIVTDVLRLPSDLHAGTYQLRVSVTDPNGYRKPLKLAIEGCQSDGSYVLTDVTVR